jgi:hypothetical protein
MYFMLLKIKYSKHHFYLLCCMCMNSASIFNGKTFCLDVGKPSEKENREHGKQCYVMNNSVIYHLY